MIPKSVPKPILTKCYDYFEAFQKFEVNICLDDACLTTHGSLFHSTAPL